MKPWLVKILIGVIGFGGGFAAGFFCHKKLNDIQFEEVSEEEMRELEENNQNILQQAVEVQKETDKTIEEMKAVQESIEQQLDILDENETKKALQGKKPYYRADEEQKEQYNKMWEATRSYSSEENANNIPVPPDISSEEGADEHPTEEDFDEDFLEQIEKEAEEAGSNFVEPPHTITLDLFYNERPEFDKITIDWYEPDNVWLDEREEVIPDIRSYVGMEVKSLFASNKGNEDPDVRFVRNEKYSTDYEIIRHHRSWRETSGGVN